MVMRKGIEGSCKPDFQWTTILAAQLIEIHVWPSCYYLWVLCCCYLLLKSEKYKKNLEAPLTISKQLHRWSMQHSTFKYLKTLTYETQSIMTTSLGNMQSMINGHHSEESLSFGIK